MDGEQVAETMHTHNINPFSDWRQQTIRLFPSNNSTVLNNAQPLRTLEGLMTRWRIPTDVKRVDVRHSFVLLEGRIFIEDDAESGSAAGAYKMGRQQLYNVPMDTGQPELMTPSIMDSGAVVRRSTVYVAGQVVYDQDFVWRNTLPTLMSSDAETTEKFSNFF